MNASGLQPVEYKILIQPEDAEETDPALRAAKAVGIQLIETVSEREQMKQVKGKLISVGGNAFEDWKGIKPEIGQTVYFAKYAGIQVKGEDGNDYRLANDKDISAVVL